MDLLLLATSTAPTANGQGQTSDLGTESEKSAAADSETSQSEDMPGAVRVSRVF